VPICADSQLSSKEISSLGQKGLIAIAEDIMSRTSVFDRPEKVKEWAAKMGTDPLTLWQCFCQMMEGFDEGVGDGYVRAMLLA